MKSKWRKSYWNGRQKIKCKACGEVFIHYSPNKPQPGRKKFCDRCTTFRSTACRRKYVEKMQQV